MRSDVQDVCDPAGAPEAAGIRLRAAAAPRQTSASALLPSAAALLPAAVALVLQLLGPAPAAAQGRGEERMDGEYGLYVGVSDDSLDVRWITKAAGPAFARLVRDGKVADSAVSSSGRGHAVLFRRPRGSRLTLEYGSVSDSSDRHATELRLDAPKPDRNPRYDAPDSLYVLGDVHGEFDNLTGVLRNAGLVGPDLSWSGSKATLVLVGDLVDRGADATRVLWYAYRLEREAAAAGGRVLVMLGNHEIMVMTNDLRYTTGKERLVASLEGLPYWRMLDPRRSLLGRWLASKPALARVGNVLFAHGGLGYGFADWSLRAYQDSLTKYVNGEVFRIWADTAYRPDPRRVQGMDSLDVIRRFDFFFGDSSVFWYRGYVRSDTLGAELAHALARQHAAVHVVGHTPIRTIRQSYGDSLIAVDMLDPASEMLLMVRDGSGRAEGGWRRYRIGLEGPPEPLPPSGSAKGEEGAEPDSG